ncbi:MAG: hypothetical protein AAGA27_05630 [Pseudomonadota bacterium]
MTGALFGCDQLKSLSNIVLITPSLSQSQNLETGQIVTLAFSIDQPAQSGLTPTVSVSSTADVSYPDGSNTCAITGTNTTCEVRVLIGPNSNGNYAFNFTATNGTLATSSIVFSILNPVTSIAITPSLDQSTNLKTGQKVTLTFTADQIVAGITPSVAVSTAQGVDVSYPDGNFCIIESGDTCQVPVIIGTNDNDTYTFNFTPTSATLTESSKDFTINNPPLVTAVGFDGDGDASIQTYLPSGSSWATQPTGLGSEGSLFSIAFANVNPTTTTNANANDVYVAVGTFSSAPNSLILTSPDGANWIRQTISSNERLNDVIYANEQFVVVGNSGQIVSSVVGNLWDLQQVGTEDFYGVAYGNGLFVAVGSNPSQVAISSNSGENWNLENTNQNNGVLNSITYSDGQFVAVGQGGTIVTSTDGVNWTTQTSTTTETLNRIIYAEGMFVAVGNNGTVVTSLDGIIWTSQTIGGGADNLFGIRYIPSYLPVSATGLFIAVGSNGSIYTSPTAASSSWTSRTGASGIDTNRDVI